MKDTHTHRGHCQFCLRVIAIDVTTGRLAKHGYTVEGGMFNGACPGSEELSLHVERTHTDRVIAMYNDKGVSLAKEAALLEAGKIHPLECVAGTPYGSLNDLSDDGIKKYWNFEYRTVQMPRINPRTGKTEMRDVSETVKVSWELATKVQRRRAVLFAISEARHGSENAFIFARDMTKWAAEVFDAKMPAYRNEDLDEWAKVGAMVRSGGEKNGFEAIVEAVELQDYKTFGFSRGSRTVKVPHALITRPAIADTFTKNGKVKKAGRPAKQFWEPVRNLKPAEGSLIDRLKKANLI